MAPSSGSNSEKIVCGCAKCGGKRSWARKTVKKHMKENPPEPVQPTLSFSQWQAMQQGQSSSTSAQVGDKRRLTEEGDGNRIQRMRTDFGTLDERHPRDEEQQAQIEEEAEMLDLTFPEPERRADSPTLSYCSVSHPPSPSAPPLSPTLSLSNMGLNPRVHEPDQLPDVPETPLSPPTPHSPVQRPEQPTTLSDHPQSPDYSDDNDDQPEYAELPPDSDDEDDDVFLLYGERELDEDDITSPATEQPPPIPPLPPTPPPPAPPPRRHIDDYKDPEIQPSRIESVRIAQEFVEDIRKATLDNGKLPEGAIHRLRNPVSTCPAYDDPLDLMYLRLYDLLHPYPQSIWKGLANILASFDPRIQLPSLYKMKKEIATTTGVVSVVDDMCINGCVAFVGQWEHLESCPMSDCGEPRYDQKVLEKTGKKKARKVATTIPFGPQHQVLRMSAQGAANMRYRDKKVQEVYQRLQDVSKGVTQPGQYLYDDIYSGKEYLNLHQSLKLTEDDTLVSFSVDGAQLIRNKKSDTYIAVWIVQDYDPTLRFKKRRILPAFICPGPHAPKNLDSFAYRSFHHLSALQRENDMKGVKVWDGLKGAEVFSRIIFWLNLADAVALPDMDGRVGHHGAKGCRLGCPMKGRHKSSGHYHAAHLCPNACNVVGSNHPDTDIHNIQLDSPEQYERDLALVESSTTQADYEKN